MKNMIILILTLGIYMVFGMDDLTDTPVESSEYQSSLTDYTKRDQDLDDLNYYTKTYTYNDKNSNHDYILKKQYKTEKNSRENNLSKTSSEEKFDQSNKLKRKHKSEKIFGCEFCQKERIKYVKSSISGVSLCESCYRHEIRNGYLVPLNERKKYVKHKDHTLVCEFCQRESIKYAQGKISGKSLCEECYQYEYRNGDILPLNERKKLVRHKNHILVCEFCQKESTHYKKGRISGQSLCESCYRHEIRNGYLVPLNERKKYVKHKDHILVCEFCQKESTQYKKGKISGQSLCNLCYHYEYYHGHLVPLDERKKRENHNGQIVCEFCLKEHNTFFTGKVSGKSLCFTCYNYERRYSQVIPLEKRKKNGKHKDHVLVCEFCQKESTRFKTGKISKKSLCNPCYAYEYKYGHLVRLDKDKKNQCKNTKSDQANRLIDTEKF